MTLHVIENDVWQVGLLPATGMSTAFGRMKRAGGVVDFLRPTPEGAYGRASDCASYLLIPWSNRVKSLFAKNPLRCEPLWTYQVQPG